MNIGTNFLHDCVNLLVNSCENFTLILASVSIFDVGNCQFHKTTTDRIIDELGQVPHLSPRFGSERYGLLGQFPPVWINSIES